jgi:DNA-directed RNA polymerase specialized sigma24 family protein
MLREIESLYRERFRDFTRAAAAIVGDEEAGRDAVQDAFAKLVRKRRRFRAEGSLEAWAWRFVVNAARDARPRRSHLPADPEQVAARAEDLGLPLELLTTGNAKSSSSTTTPTWTTPRSLTRSGSAPARSARPSRRLGKRCEAH